LIIHLNLSYPTVPGWFPDPFFRVYVKNVHKDKHGSDSMTFDNEGRFRPQQFEDLFEKYDEGDKGGLDIWDVMEMIKGQRLVLDVFGWLAAIFECEFHLSVLRTGIGRTGKMI
jgi:peroxygenase